jgi:hypothetical protein
VESLPQGILQGVFIKSTAITAIHVQFMQLPQCLEQIPCAAGAGNRAGKLTGKLASLAGIFFGWQGLSKQRGEFFTRSFAGG